MVSLLASPIAAQSHLGDLAPAGGQAHDQFGAAIACDGQRLLVSSAGADSPAGWQDVGEVHVFERQGSTWVPSAILRPSDPTHELGFGRALVLDGDWALVGAPLAHANGEITGAVYAFELVGQGWVERQKLVGSRSGNGDRFGESIAGDDERLIVGAPAEDAPLHDSGAAYLYRLQYGIWSHVAILEAPQPSSGARFGSAVAIDDDAIAIAAPWKTWGGEGSGSVYVFGTSGTSWHATAEVRADADVDVLNFGRALDLQGGTLAVGSPNARYAGVFAGAVDVFERDGDGWERTAWLLPPGGGAYDRFGTAVDLREDSLVVGAPWQDQISQDGGMLWFYGRAGASWVEVASAAPANLQPGSRLGISMSGAGDRLVVGAPYTPANGSSVGAASLWRTDDLPALGSYCEGVGCPCGNEDPGGGCTNSTGRGARLSASGSLSIARGQLSLHADRLPPGRMALWMVGTAPGAGILGDGILCLQLGGGLASASLAPPTPISRQGELHLDVAPHLSGMGLGAGSTAYCQLVYREGAGPCNNPFNLTNGLKLSLTP